MATTQTMRVLGAVASIWLALVTAASADETLTFREGVNGYAATQDLHLAVPADFYDSGRRASVFETDPDNPQWVWDFENAWGEGTVRRRSGSTRYGAGDNLGLLHFGDIFGVGANQIPPGSEIVSATLSIHPDTSTFIWKAGDSANLHQVLVGWDESTRWETFGPSPGPDRGVDFSSQIEIATGSMSGSKFLDVTGSVTGWSSDPSSNRGWLIMPTGTQDSINVSGSALGSVTSVTVDLDISGGYSGGIVATLEHGDYSALLLNRIGSNCDSQFGNQGSGIDITLDATATDDIHDSSNVSLLTGTWRPDAACVDLPLCPGGGGLCGQPADGDWTLTLFNEWSASVSSATLNSWGITLSDGVNWDESYVSTPAFSVPNRQAGSRRTTDIWSSEAPVVDNRPQLEVTFRPAIVSAEISLDAWPSSGTQSVPLSIPPGSNASAAVTLTVSSDTPLVAQVLNSPLVFAQSGSTTQLLQLSIGQVGSAIVTSTNDAGLPDFALPVSVSNSAIQLSPAALYEPVNAPDGSLTIAVPLGSNASSDVDVTLTSSDTAVADFAGAVAGSLNLTFSAGASNSQSVVVQYGSTPGTANFVVSDDAATIASAGGAAVLTAQGPIEYDINIVPYVQLGNPPLAPTTDQFVIAWQTITRSSGGPVSDSFVFEYRRVGDVTWVPVSLEVPIPFESTSRLNQYVVVDNLAFDESYEYRLIHYRDGVALPGGSYQDVVDTQKSSPFRFTAFGNTGQASSGQQVIADLLATLGSDLHLLLGDSIYYHGQYEHAKSRINEPYAASMPSTIFHYALGNHDVLTDGGRPHRDHFYEPENGPAGLDSELNYSFDYGDVHFVSINTIPVRDEVGPWLDADLAATTKTWKVIFVHEPPVTRDPYGVDRQESADVRDELLTRAIAHGVDLFIAGAVHSMQRYLPITSVLPSGDVTWSSCEEGPGTTLIYPGSGAWLRGPPGPIPDPLELPMQVYAPELGIGIFDVAGDALTASFVDQAGATIDSVTLTKCDPGPCVCAEICDDGLDNDTDGDADCEDTDCDGVDSCELGVELTCNDAFDNDGDGSDDCGDPDCDGVDGCEFGAELSCDDGFDNDEDLVPDCEDPDCDGIADCEFGTELSCTDEIDNDADGVSDCHDPDCVGAPGGCPIIPSAVPGLGVPASGLLAALLIGGALLRWRRSWPAQSETS